ncbi:GyrI-like domain-containing protein [Salicibibacter cibarius]|uniref:GyrI-like domain-containing protein n=1 Tax=Salicibibacter cibarius TaxID=2743000 RepID=A0A7T6Z3M3_9BACI|nr:GyrI-like domain-containing protein [Salicibibacter cibarius]
MAEELNLDKEIPHMTGISLFQFKKLFLLLAHMPLLEYIRKRRMALAGYDLRERKMKVIDVAVKYGYDSPDAFAKAFYKVHEVNPSNVYEEKTLIKSYSPIYFQLTMIGGSQMNYRIEEKNAFNVVGIQKRIPFVKWGKSKAITTIKETLDDEMYHKLNQLSNVEPYGGYSAVYNIMDFEDETNAQCDFILGTLTTKENVFDLDALYVPEATWAIFTSDENKQLQLQEVWAKIYTEWQPSSEYEIIDDAPGIFFMENEGVDDPSVRKEIWVQVKNSTFGAKNYR